MVLIIVYPVDSIARTYAAKRSFALPFFPPVDAFNFSFLVAPSKKDPGSFRVVTGGTGCEDFTTDLSGLVSVPGDAGSPFDYVKM